MTLPRQARQARCTFCGTTFFPSASPAADDAPPKAAASPFCSDRCRLDDLGRWLGGGYVIAGPPVVSEDDGSADHEGGGTPS